MPRQRGTCSLPGCEKPHYSKGWCRMHYQRWRMHGDPEKVRTAIGAPLEFFETVVLATETDACVLWPFGRGDDGCGILFYEGRTRRVPRLICELLYGPAPSRSHQAAHGCGRGHDGCVNPNHLRWATPAENCADRDLHGTSLRGERNHKAKLTREDVASIRQMRGTRSQEAIGKLFGVSQRTVSLIHLGRIWRV